MTERQPDDQVNHVKSIPDRETGTAKALCLERTCSWSFEELKKASVVENRECRENGSGVGVGDSGDTWVEVWYSSALHPKSNRKLL